MQFLIVTAEMFCLPKAAFVQNARSISALVRNALGAAMETLRFSTALCPTCVHFRHDHRVGDLAVSILLSNCKFLSSRWRDHSDNDGDGFCQNVWFVESLALALGLSLRPQAEATILPIGSVGSRCDSSKDTVQTFVEKCGGEIGLPLR